MKQITIKYGLITGFILSVIFLISYFLFMKNPEHYTSGEIVGYITMILSLLGVFFGIKSYKDKKTDGRMNFKKGMAVGTLIALIAGLVFGVYTMFFVGVLEPGFAEQYQNHIIKQINNSDASPEEKKEQVEQLLKQPEWMKSTPFQGFIMFFTVFGIGVIISLVSALILKTPAKNHV